MIKSTEGGKFKAQFDGADKLTDEEFLFFWSDSIVEKIQYGSRTQLCDSVKGKSSDDLLKIFIDIVKTNGVHEYGSFYLKNYTYYAYFIGHLDKKQILQGLGCFNVVLNTDGGKRHQISIQLDQN